MEQFKSRFIKWFSAVVNAVLMVYVLAVIGTIALINPNRAEISEIEKRELAKCPEFSFSALKSGEYTEELSLFFADTFPLRDGLIKIGSAVREHMGFRLDNIRLYSGGAEDAAAIPDNVVLPQAGDSVIAVPPSQAASSQAAPSQAASSQAASSQAASSQASSSQAAASQAASSSQSASSQAAPSQAASSQSASSQAEGAGSRIGAIFTYGDTGYTIFGGSNAMGKWYADVINAYGDALGDKIRIYDMVVPTAIEFTLPERYKSVSTPQRPRLDNIAACLSDKIEWVDIYDEIAAHSSEYLYFRTDHHWTSLGAYYAYTAFAKTAGFEPMSLDGLEKRSLNGFLGTLYSQTQDSLMAANPDRVDYYIFPQMPKCYMYKNGSPNTALGVSLYGEYAKTYNSYSVFLHGDVPVTVIDTGVKNGRRIAVVKESYGNAFVPYLVNNYERVVVIDQRYLQKGFYDVLAENGVNELLFLNNILAAHTTVRIQELTTLPVRTYVPPVSSSEEPAAQSSSEAASQED